jgi:hypothetical protein
MQDNTNTSYASTANYVQEDFSPDSRPVSSRLLSHQNEILTVLSEMFESAEWNATHHAQINLIRLHLLCRTVNQILVKIGLPKTKIIFNDNESCPDCYYQEGIGQIIISQKILSAPTAKIIEEISHLLTYFEQDVVKIQRIGESHAVGKIVDAEQAQTILGALGYLECDRFFLQDVLSSRGAKRQSRAERMRADRLIAEQRKKAQEYREYSINVYLSRLLPAYIGFLKTASDDVLDNEIAFISQNANRSMLMEQPEIRRVIEKQTRTSKAPASGLVGGSDASLRKSFVDALTVSCFRLFAQKPVHRAKARTWPWEQEACQTGKDFAGAFERASSAATCH